MEYKLPELPELKFDKKEHKYTLNDFALPSVTTLMEPLSRRVYRDVSEETLEQAAERGEKVHESLEIYMMFGVEDIDKDLVGYLDAFKKWQEKRKPELVATEYRMYHKGLRYSGTGDLIAVIDNKLTLVDYKTTSAHLPILTRVQTEAYVQALRSLGIDIEQKIVLQLKKNGSYREDIHELHDTRAWKVFCDFIDLEDYINSF